MLKAGKYFVGDLCYVMHPQWGEFCDKTIRENEVIDGEVTLDNGVKVISLRTYFGDGCYDDQLGNSYGVDAGLIGCIRVEDINDPESWLEGGNIIDFPYDFEGQSKEGILYIGHIRIDTKCEDNCGDDEE